MGTDVLEGVKVHPAAALLPEPTAEEYAELKADIEKNGLREKIVMLGDEVLDGRSRYRALVDLGMWNIHCDGRGFSARPEHWYTRQATPEESADPAGFAVSKNLKRRHLTVQQRAAVALAMLPMLEEQARKRQEASRFGAEGDGGRQKKPTMGDVGLAPMADVQRAPMGDVRRVRSGKYQKHWVRRKSAAEAARLVGVSASTVERAKRLQRAGHDGTRAIKAASKALLVGLAVGDIKRARTRLGQTRAVPGIVARLEGIEHDLRSWLAKAQVDKQAELKKAAAAKAKPKTKGKARARRG